MAISEKVQNAYSVILKFFIQHGRAPHYTELSERMGLGVEAARELQRETAETASQFVGGYWLAHDTDYIESWAPFSNVPTHHLISIDGQSKWYAQ